MLTQQRYAAIDRTQHSTIKENQSDMVLYHYYAMAIGAAYQILAKQIVKSISVNTEVAARS
jgi:hypothetical protein